jgi:hypothetical protein
LSGTFQVAVRSPLLFTISRLTNWQKLEEWPANGGKTTCRLAFGTCQLSGHFTFGSGGNR